MRIGFYGIGAYCECGRKLENTGDGYYTYAEYSNGELIFAKCNHGNIVINRRNKNQKALDANLILSPNQHVKFLLSV